MDRRIRELVFRGCAGLLLAGALGVPAYGQVMYFVPAGADPNNFGSGPTKVNGSTAVGSSLTFELYARDVLIDVRGVAASLACTVPGGSAGSIHYQQESGIVDTENPLYIHRNSPFAFGIVDESGCLLGNPTAFRYAVAAASDAWPADDPAYFGEFTLDVSADASGEFVLSLIGCNQGSGGDECLGTTQLADILNVPIEGVVGLDLIINIGGSSEPPAIVHGDEPGSQTAPCSGYIDPRRDSTDGDVVDLGVDMLTIQFDQPVFSAEDGGPVGPGDFEITETGGGEPPDVVDVVNVGGNDTVFRLTLSRHITVQEWTTVRAIVESAGGTPIENLDSLGEDDNEPDRVDIGYLPGDINQSGNSSPLDLTRAQQFQLGTCPDNIACPDCGGSSFFYDTDRNGSTSPIDLTRLQQLFLNLGNSTRRWNGERMNNDRP